MAKWPSIEEWTKEAGERLFEQFKADFMKAYKVPLETVAAVADGELAPVRHGRWIWNPNGMDWGLGAWMCSECACRNHNIPDDDRIKPLRFSGSRYCPNCGAKMNGGDER